VHDPYDILKQRTPFGKIVMKKYLEIKRSSTASSPPLAIEIRENIVVCVFQLEKNSFAKEIAQALVRQYPGKIIMVLRKHEGIYMGSRCEAPRSSPRLNAAYNGLRGSVGGHDEAAGINVHEDDLPPADREAQP